MRIDEKTKEWTDYLFNQVAPFIEDNCEEDADCVKGIIFKVIKEVIKDVITPRSF